MEIDEIIEREVAGDPRIFYTIQKLKIQDKSFTEKGFLGIAPRYPQSEVREIWLRGISIGMEQGLKMAGLAGQKIDLYMNCKDERQREYLDKLYKLSEEYNCAVAFTPNDGMCVIDLKP